MQLHKQNDPQQYNKTFIDSLGRSRETKELHTLSK